MTERKFLVFNFADVEVREREFFVFRLGEALSVEPRAFRVLLFLLRNPHRLITKDELLNAVWNDMAVTENSLTRSIALLRRVLGDDTHDPRYIATVPTIGYRFLLDVQSKEDDFPRLDNAKSPTLPETGDVHPATQSQQQDEPFRVIRKRSNRIVLLGAGAAVLGIAAMGLLLRPVVGKLDPPTHAFARATEQRVTFNPPEAPIRFAIISPDGRYLAYTDTTGLYLREIASGETRPWGVPKNFIASPSGWFPDGTHLLVTRFEGSSVRPSIWKLSLLGGNPEMLMDNAAAGVVSPDGSRIAYLSGPSLGSELWLMDSGGDHPQKIAAADAGRGNKGSQIWPLAWSPGGRRIAYIQSRGNPGPSPVEDGFSLQTRAANGDDPQVLLSDTRLKQTVCWAPDGRIFFAYSEDSTSQRSNQGVYSLLVDESTGKALGPPTAVTTGQGRVGGLSVTANGGRLFLWRDNTQPQAFVAEFQAKSRLLKTPRRLTLDANGNLAEAWTSDSRSVLFVSNRNGTWKLFKQAIDQTTAEVLVEGRSLFLPRLSPDGRDALYLSYPPPENPSLPVAIMRKPLAGGPPEVVLQKRSISNLGCAHTPSPLCVFSTSGEADQVLTAFDLDHGPDRELSRVPNASANWVVSPDGTALAIFPDSHHIRFVQLNSGVARDVRVDGWPVVNGDWSADSKSVFIQSAKSNRTPVILDVDSTGKVQLVLEGDPNTRFDWMIQSPDGRLALLEEEIPGDNNVWMVENF